MRKNRFLHQQYDPNLNNYYFEGVYEPNEAYPASEENQEIVEYILTKGKHAAKFRKGQQPPKFVITSICDQVRQASRPQKPKRSSFRPIGEYSSKGIYGRFEENMKKAEPRIDYEKQKDIRDSVQKGMKKYIPTSNNIFAMQRVEIDRQLAMGIGVARPKLVRP